RQYAPHYERRERPRVRRHDARPARHRRRRRLHRRGIRHHRGRPARRARNRPRAPGEPRKLRRKAGQEVTAPTSTLPDRMAMLETHTVPATYLQSGYEKRLMLFSGRANPELAAKIADKLGIELGPITLKTFSNGEVYCRY